MKHTLESEVGDWRWTQDESTPESLVLACIPVLGVKGAAKSVFLAWQHKEAQKNSSKQLMLHTYVTTKKIDKSGSKANSKRHVWPALLLDSQSGHFCLWLLWCKQPHRFQARWTCCAGLWLPLQIPHLHIDRSTSVVVT